MKTGFIINYFYTAKLLRSRLYVTCYILIKKQLTKLSYVSYKKKDELIINSKNLRLISFDEKKKTSK